MNVIVDGMRVREFARRIVKGELRYYHEVFGYDCLLLVTVDRSYEEVINQKVGDQRFIALFNFDDTDGDLVLKEFPTAPARWAGLKNGELIQCTIKEVSRLSAERPVRLSEAIRLQIGPGC